ncbi:MAG: DNA ligase [Solobacterium sp.]|jgi:hypothetical protein|nr:DNA ligase [Solobacterium sp.]
MSKMSEMDLTIKELRDAAATIADAADFLTKAFSAAEESKTETKADKQQIENFATEEIKSSEPEEKTLTLAEVRGILAKKSRAGHTAEVRDLLKKYGASRLSEIDPTHYKALVQDAEEIAND